MTYRARHRRQALEGDWASHFGCTAVASLVAMDQATLGVVGPQISADEFRARQPDQVEGIDLHDARIAAASFGVALEVCAAYGGTAAATYLELVELGAPAARRALVIQGDHDRLPLQLRCAGFLGNHAVESPGWRASPTGMREWLVSNPLCADYVTWPDTVMRAYTEALAGADRVWVAAAPPTPEVLMNPTLLRPVLRCDVAGPLTVYAAPDRSSILIASWPGGSDIHLFAPAKVPTEPSGKATLVPILLDFASGPAEELRIGWVGTDRVSNVRPADPPDCSGATAPLEASIADLQIKLAAAEAAATSARGAALEEARGAAMKGAGDAVDALPR